MNSRLIPVIGLAMAWQLGASSACGDETNTAEMIKQLQQRIEELERKVRSLETSNTVRSNPNDTRVENLDQKVRVLERKNELAEEAAGAKVNETPKVTIGENGFAMTSANGSFALQIKGVLQVDSRTFFGDAGVPGNDGFLLRRARPILQGTVFKDFDFQFVPDFGGTGSPQIYDAFLNYRNRPALQLEVGKFKTPVGLEQLLADRDIMFNERSMVTDLVPNRDLGVQLHGELFGGIVKYAAGVFNGVGDARNSNNADFEDNKSFAGRLFFQPFKKSDTVLQGLGFGAGASYEDVGNANASGLPSTTGGTLPGYATVGQQQFFAYNPAAEQGRTPVVVADGAHWRLSPQAGYSYGPWNLLAEYAISDQRVSRTVVAPFVSRELEHTAWQVSAGWVLTGEDFNFNGGVVPQHPFSPGNGNWGAFQLVARYSQLDIDSEAFGLFSDPTRSASAAHEYSFGLNWWLSRNVRVGTSYSYTTFDGGGTGTSAPGVVTRNPENVLFTRVQLAF
jgi:phosphate-selective porin OprO/OprP